MIIRKYHSSDLEQIAKLFYDTVHAVNAKDYTQEQLNAWATGQLDLAAWDQSFLEHETYVAEERGLIAGFGDIDRTGYLDRLYVHKDFQNRGIATAICDALEQTVDGEKLHTHASITAKPFFEKRGYRAIRAQRVERQGVFLTNYLMEKEGKRRDEDE